MHYAKYWLALPERFVPRAIARTGAQHAHMLRDTRRIVKRDSQPISIIKHARRIIAWLRVLFSAGPNASSAAPRAP